MTCWLELLINYLRDMIAAAKDMPEMVLKLGRWDSTKWTEPKIMMKWSWCFCNVFCVGTQGHGFSAVIFLQWPCTQCPDQLHISVAVAPQSTGLASPQRHAAPAHGTCQTFSQGPSHASPPFAIVCRVWLSMTIQESPPQDPWRSQY